MAIEPIIEPITEPIGTVIRGPFGKGTPEQLIPAEGTPTHFNKYNAGPSWGDVYDWVKSKFVDDTRDQVQLNVQGVLNAVLTGLQRMQEALSGFHNLSFDYTATVAAHVHLALNFVQRLIDVSTFDLQSQIDAGAWDAAVRENRVTADLRATEQALNARILQSSKATSDALQGWTLSSVAKPLTENLGRVNDNLTHLIDVKSLEAVGAAVGISAGSIAKVASQLNAVRAAQAAAKAWQDECGDPMCQTMGPKTDLGKLLKGINVAQWAALLLALSLLTADEAEKLAETVVALAAGSVEDFVGAWLGEGRTLGGAIASTVETVL